MRERLRRGVARLSGSAAAPIRGFDLRHDQEIVFQRFAAYLAEHGGTHLPGAAPFCRIVLPPRTGKTVLAGHIIGRSGLCAAVIVPTRVLAQQTRRLLESVLPDVPVGLLTGDERQVVEHGVNVTTYSMLQEFTRLGPEALPGGLFKAGLVFVDEAHRAMTAGRMKALRELFDPDALRIGLTATPDYDSERRLGRFFPELIHELSLEQALGLGLLAPVRVWVAEVDHAGSRVRLVAGEYDREMLARQMSSAPFFKAAQAFRYADTNRGKAALLCCATRQQAHDLHQFLLVHRPAGSPAPGLVLGDTSRQEREQALDSFESGALDTLVQVGVLIEGWSSPRCKLLIDLAPSVSRVRAAQKYFRPMTRDGAAVAHVYVLLPALLPALPTLPTDLFGAPPEGYTCGELVAGPQGTDANRAAVGAGLPTPIAGVRLRQRILLSTTLRCPALRRGDREGLARVLASTDGFDPADPPSLRAFRALLFHHPLFTGRGEALLEWLGFASNNFGYQQFLLRGCPDALASRLLAEAGTGGYAVREETCASDVAALTRARFGDEAGAESWPAGLGSDAGFGTWGVAASRPALDRKLVEDDLALVRELLFDLSPRRLAILERRFGLHGEERRTLAQLGAEEEVTVERVRSIALAGLYQLRRAIEQHRLSEKMFLEAPAGTRCSDWRELIYRSPRAPPNKRERLWMATVLAALTERAEPVSTTELAEQLGVTRLQTARGLLGLVKGGQASALADGYVGGREKR